MMLCKERARDQKRNKYFLFSKIDLIFPEKSPLHLIKPAVNYSHCFEDKWNDLPENVNLNFSFYLKS